MSPLGDGFAQESLAGVGNGSCRRIVSGEGIAVFADGRIQRGLVVEVQRGPVPFRKYLDRLSRDR